MTMSDTYLTAREVKARYKISKVTLHRWQNSETMAFPQPHYLNRRRLFSEAELMEWDRTQIRKATGARA